MAIMGFFFGLLTMFPTTVPQLIGIGMLVVFRPLFYTAISCVPPPVPFTKSN
jgi:hypothetical protein